MSPMLSGLACIRSIELCTSQVERALPAPPGSLDSPVPPATLGSLEHQASTICASLFCSQNALCLETAVSITFSAVFSDVGYTGATGDTGSTGFTGTTGFTGVDIQII